MYGTSCTGDDDEVKHPIVSYSKQSATHRKPSLIKVC